MDELRKPEGPSSTFGAQESRHVAAARQAQAGYPVGTDYPSARGLGSISAAAREVSPRTDIIGQAGLIHGALTQHQEVLASLLQALDALRDKLEVAGLLRRDIPPFVREEGNAQSTPPAPVDAPPNTKLGEELFNARTRVTRLSRISARSVQDLANLIDALDL